MQIKIYPAARASLLEIWGYTKNTHGQKQADTYVRGIDKAINNLHNSQHLWYKVEDSELIGVFFVRNRNHYIFFRKLSISTIGVIAILHEKMDILSCLKSHDITSD